MPRVEDLADVTRCDPEVVVIEHLPSQISAEEHNAEQPVERTGCALKDAEQQEQAIPAHDGGSAAAPPARSVRRATARRASNRRATARSRQADSEASITDFLVQHPGSTAGDLAKGLNLNPGQVSTHLTKLALTGEIKKASHGYSATQPARPRPHERPLRHSD
jgi:predicted Rossmann fold nucleotide-binding protein DprA/Smf involved in DNA uptake